MDLLPLNDPRWKTYKSGFNRTPYDASGLAAQLIGAGPSAALWDACWGDLHHQGDVGEASYALVPYVVEYIRRSRAPDAMAAAFILTVEESRSGNGNPPLPPELLKSYEASLRELPAIALSEIPVPWSEDFLRYVVALIALANGQRTLATAYQDFSSSEAQQWLSTYYGESR